MITQHWAVVLQRLLLKKIDNAKNCTHNWELVCQGDEGRAMAGYPPLQECLLCGAKRWDIESGPAHPMGLLDQHIGEKE